MPFPRYIELNRGKGNIEMTLLGTTIKVNYDEDTITLSREGNSGDTIEDVKQATVICFGPEWFESLEECCNNMTEQGSPDSSYTRVMQF